jgi:hypothetical protein
MMDGPLNKTPILRTVAAARPAFAMVGGFLILVFDPKT